MDKDFQDLLLAILQDGWSVNRINHGTAGPGTFQIRISKPVTLTDRRPGYSRVDQGLGNGFSLTEALTAAMAAAGVELDGRPY